MKDWFWHVLDWPATVLYVECETCYFYRAAMAGFIVGLAVGGLIVGL